MEALKQAAVDPSTGKIDISILTTGISGAARKRKAEVAQALHKMMRAKRQPTYNTATLYEELKAQSDIVSSGIVSSGIWSAGVSFTHTFHTWVI